MPTAGSTSQLSSSRWLLLLLRSLEFYDLANLITFGAIPLWPGNAIDGAEIRVRDVAQPRDWLELQGVDYTSLVKHVVADVNVLDVTENEGRSVLAGLGVRDFNCLI